MHGREKIRRTRPFVRQSGVHAAGYSKVCDRLLNVSGLSKVFHQHAVLIAVLLHVEKRIAYPPEALAFIEIYGPEVGHQHPKPVLLISQPNERLLYSHGKPIAHTHPAEPFQHIQFAQFRGMDIAYRGRGAIFYFGNAYKVILVNGNDDAVGCWCPTSGR